MKRRPKRKTSKHQPLIQLLVLLAPEIKAILKGEKT
jgi:hypothetical protein